MVDPERAWFATPNGKPGHPERFPAAAIQFCLSVKVLFGLPLRQATGFVESLLALSGLDWSVPDYTTLCRRQKQLNVQIPYRAAPVRRDQLHDDIALALDAITAPQPGPRETAEAASYLRHALRLIKAGVTA